jgi:hypothetical protein
LLYETCRLAALVRIMGPGEGVFPNLIFGAANALFPLMTLFLLADFNCYIAYTSLYTAGKTLSALALVSAGIFQRDRVIQAVMLNGPALLYAAGGLALIALGDTLTAACGLWMVRYARRAKAAASPEKLEGPAIDDGENGGF